MDVGGMALCRQGLVSQFHRRTGGKHRVSNDQRLAVKARAGDILDVNHKVISLGEVLPVGRNKGVFSAVKVAQETLMKRKSGTQESCKHHVVGQHIALLHTQRSGHPNGTVLEFLGDFIGHNLTQALDVGTETQAFQL